MENLITKAIGILGGLKIGGQLYGAIEVYNDTGVAIVAGSLVYISGYNATYNLPTIADSDSDVTLKPAQFVCPIEIGIGKRGWVYEKYEVGSLNTNAGVVGDKVYLSDIAGEWTLSAPTGADKFVQVVGFITVKSATVGRILFLIQPAYMGALGSSAFQPLSVLTGIIAANGVETTNIKNGQVTKVKLAGGFNKVTLAAGTAGGANVTIAGMVVGDELVSVLSFTTAAAIATLADRTSEYVIGAGVLTKAAGTDESNNQLVVFWNDLT